MIVQRTSSRSVQAILRPLVTMPVETIVVQVFLPMETKAAIRSLCTWMRE